MSVDEEHQRSDVSLDDSTREIVIGGIRIPVEKLTPEIFMRLVENNHKLDELELSALRRLQFLHMGVAVFVVLALVFVVWLFRDNDKVITAIIALVGGFGGGWGVARDKS
ncbi:MAG: hypothetical protein ACPGXK_03810 [Phycisphaerae bacterium]